MYWIHCAVCINSGFIYIERMGSLHSHIESSHPPPSYPADETPPAGSRDRWEWVKGQKERGRMFNEKNKWAAFNHLKYSAVMSPGTHPIRGLWSGEGYVIHCCLCGWNAPDNHGSGLAVTVATPTARSLWELRSWVAGRPPDEGLHQELITHTHTHTHTQMKN